MIEKLEHAIQKGTSYLYSQQCLDGNYDCYLSKDLKSFDQAQVLYTNFIPALILSSLAPIKSKQAKDINKKLADFLLSQKNAQWAFNYWSTNEPERMKRSYPDDLDDTFCALSALFLHDPGIISEETLAYVVKMLLATEIEVGGPYRTWLASLQSDKIWLDVDLAVNSNVAYFLSLISTPPPGIIKLVEESIRSGIFSSPYYLSSYPIIYFISRFYKGSLKDDLIAHIIDLQPCSAHDRALVISSLINLGAPLSTVENHVQSLLAQQHGDGSWTASAICVYRYTVSGTYYVGSPALTTAFALEALALYGSSSKPALHSKSARPSPLAKSIRKNIRTDLVAISRPQKETLKTLIEKTLKSNNGPEITQLALHCNQSLITPLSRDDSLYSKLGTANVYGWVAYTIYDNIIDHEGSTELLPTANIAMRLSYDHFIKIAAQKPALKHYIRNTFIAIDSANTWELQNYRYSVTEHTLTLNHSPDYTTLLPLAHRSFGHILGPLTILAFKGHSVRSKAFRHTEKALTHYLIAKQIHDDAHDWHADLGNGHINYVASTIMNDLAVTPGVYSLNMLVPTMQHYFWHNTLLAVCSTANYHTSIARKSLEKAGIFRSDSPFEKMLDGLDAITATTLTEQKRATKFLAHFK